VVRREVPPGGEVSGVSFLVAQFAANRQQLVPLTPVVQRCQPEVDYHLSDEVVVGVHGSVEVPQAEFEAHRSEVVLRDGSVHERLVPLRRQRLLLRLRPPLRRFTAIRQKIHFDIRISFENSLPQRQIVGFNDGNVQLL